MDAVPITKKLIAFGSKKIYLPKFTVALVRNRDSSPYHARFQVPLDFSKYDLRDYLYHAYNVKCFNIRSFVRQMPIRDTADRFRIFFRQESEKYMTVEMEKPFVWPEVPSLGPWGQDQKKLDVKDAVARFQTPASPEAREAARKLREQVRDLLHGPPLVAAAADTKDTAPGAASKRDKGVKRSRNKKQVQMKSKVRIWERQRTPSLAQSGRSGRFRIKA